MRNRDYVIRGLGAAVLNAEMHAEKLPEAKGISLNPVVNFEDDTIENQNNSKIVWWTKGKKKFRFRDHTEEEKRILAAAEKYKIEQMFDYILRNYGWEYAERFYNWDQWRKLFDKHGIVPNLKVPHCEYTDSRQCDLFCPFFEKKCTLEEKYYENNL